MAIRQGEREAYETVLLVAGELEAEYVPSLGMIGASLRHRGDELLGQRKGLAAYASDKSTMGIPLLHPWANRLEGTRYEAAGKTVELDPDSPLLKFNPPGAPIHGVLTASPHWEVVDGDERRLAARLDFGAHDDLLAAFPFPHEVTIEAALSDGGLEVVTTVRPTGDVPVPISFGYHPYLTLPDVPRRDWHVELPVRTHLVVDDRQIPTGETRRVDIPPGPLGDRIYDDGFADLADPPVFALEGGGRRIEVELGPGYRSAQVFAPPGEDYISFEPMTAPTNALVTGDDLPLAHPGATFEATFSIAVFGDR